MTICVSIASYRDPDLINTVNSAVRNAKNKDDILFCIVSQAEEDEHPDLSHVPNVKYIKFHWKESNGLCWARNIAINNSFGDFILQVDSHSRFVENWDEIIENFYMTAKNFWGDRIIITKNSDPFEIKDDGTEEFSHYDIVVKTKPAWKPDLNIFLLGETWHDIEDYIHGDEIFYVSGGCTFAESSIFKMVAPDPMIYHEDQMSVAIRAYTRGIRLIFCPTNFVYSLHDRSGSQDRLGSFTGQPPVVKRRLHWEDHPEFNSDRSLKSWSSGQRMKKLYRGELFGYWGIGSKVLYEQFSKMNDVVFIQDEDE